MIRLILFFVTNIAIMITLGIVAHLLGINKYLTSNGLNLQMLLMYALLFGFAGSFISLAISKPMAKWTMKLKIIDGTETSQTAWIHKTVAKFAEKSGIDMPEVAIYDSPELNAFATGPTKNNSLVAVSTGLLDKLSKEEVEAVIGHEVAHVANGDMVTMALAQGVLNTFVIFISRVLAYGLDKFISKDEETESGTSWVYMVSTIVFEILFGILASIIVSYYSRVREFAADKGGADLTSKQHMINALAKLGSVEPGELPGGLKSFGISSKPNSLLALFSTHPPIEKRIEALKNL